MDKLDGHAEFTPTKEPELGYTSKSCAASQPIPSSCNQKPAEVGPVPISKPSESAGANSILDSSPIITSPVEIKRRQEKWIRLSKFKSDRESFGRFQCDLRSSWNFFGNFFHVLRYICQGNETADGLNRFGEETFPGCLTLSNLREAHLVSRKLTRFQQLVYGKKRRHSVLELTFHEPIPAHKDTNPNSVNLCQVHLSYFEQPGRYGKFFPIGIADASQTEATFGEITSIVKLDHEKLSRAHPEKNIIAALSKLLHLEDGDHKEYNDETSNSQTFIVRLVEEMGLSFPEEFVEEYLPLAKSESKARIHKKESTFTRASKFLLTLRNLTTATSPSESDSVAQPCAPVPKFVGNDGEYKVVVICKMRKLKTRFTTRR